MDFSEVIANQRAEIGAVAPINGTEMTVVAVLIDSDIPLGMPLTTDRNDGESGDLGDP